MKGRMHSTDEGFWHATLNSMEFRPKTSLETNLNILKTHVFLARLTKYIVCIIQVICR